MNPSVIVLSVGLGVLTFMVCLAIKEILFLLKENMKAEARHEACIVLSEIEVKFLRLLQIHEMTQHNKKEKR